MKKTTIAKTSYYSINDPLLDTKIEQVTEGLETHHVNRLRTLPSIDDAKTIVNFILSMKTEINLADTHRVNYIYCLCRLSQFHTKTKTFRELSREDILLFLDSFRKPESVDPLHKWIGTYNTYRSLLLYFFKWLYYSDLEPDKRPKPLVVENIPKLKRKEQSIYKPSHLWTIEDDALFLKYCPNNRDRCYHAISRDSSCRPHEILKLRIKDLSFKTSGNFQYAEILVNGKTGSRHIPLINSIPHVKDWLDEHPQGQNPNAPLICGYDKSLGKWLKPRVFNKIYSNYKNGLFSKLSIDPNVPIDDKQKIKQLLQKPWNPYIRRHSALTEKSRILKEHVLRQHAGWSGTSQMHLKYLHYFGNESSESLLEAYGIITKDQQSTNALKPKQCPNCNEPNKPDSKFCAKCRMVLTYDAYNETLEGQRQKEDKLAIMEERYNSMQSQIQTLIATIGNIKDQNQVDNMAKALYNSGIIKNSSGAISQ
ncbi:MAG TPA: phage integrase N-terminal SAM-like domain-containing protein [Nitrososphaeraceae archaeon]|nr:phage integrase N-terminal SAM-like domain-containing protein [Nitrososphaeraceae archaeon]